jgi:hypothetical protein
MDPSDRIFGMVRFRVPVPVPGPEPPPVPVPEPELEPGEEMSGSACRRFHSSAANQR